MAKKTVLIDDIDGSPAARTVEFSNGGTSYSIDLSEANIARLNEALAPFVEVATRVKKEPARRAAEPSNKPSSTAVRTWAKEQGIEVPPRGRISTDVMRQYNEAH